MLPEACPERSKQMLNLFKIDQKHVQLILKCWIFEMGSMQTEANITTFVLLLTETELWSFVFCWNQSPNGTQRDSKKASHANLLKFIWLNGIETQVSDWVQAVAHWAICVHCVELKVTKGMVWTTLAECKVCLQGLFNWRRRASWRTLQNIFLYCLRSHCSMDLKLQTYSQRLMFELKQLRNINFVLIWRLRLKSKNVHLNYWTQIWSWKICDGLWCSIWTTAVLKSN